MIRWLFIALVIYLIFQLMKGPRRSSRKSPLFTFHVGRYPGDGHPGPQDGHNKSQNKRMDQIEDAEFEDITEKETPEKEPTEKKSDR